MLFPSSACSMCDVCILLVLAEPVKCNEPHKLVKSSFNCTFEVKGLSDNWFCSTIFIYMLDRSWSTATREGNKKLSNMLAVQHES